MDEIPFDTEELYRKIMLAAEMSLLARWQELRKKHEQQAKAALAEDDWVTVDFHLSMISVIDDQILVLTTRKLTGEMDE